MHDLVSWIPSILFLPLPMPWPSSGLLTEPIVGVDVPGWLLDLPCSYPAWCSGTSGGLYVTADVNVNTVELGSGVEAGMAIFFSGRNA